MTDSGKTASTVAVNIHISVKTGQKRVAVQRPVSKTTTVQPVKKKGCSRVSPQAWLELLAKLYSYGEAQEGSVRRHLPTAAELCATGISDTALFGPGPPNRWPPVASSSCARGCAGGQSSRLAR